MRLVPVAHHWHQVRGVSVRKSRRTRATAESRDRRQPTAADQAPRTWPVCGPDREASSFTEGTDPQGLADDERPAAGRVDQEADEPE